MWELFWNTLCCISLFCIGCGLLSPEESVVHQHSEILSKLIAVGLADSCSQVPVLYFNLYIWFESWVFQVIGCQMHISFFLIVKNDSILQTVQDGDMVTVQGAPIKNNPFGKIHYLSHCNRFCHQIYGFHRGGFRPCKQQISLQYLLWFKNYNHLNLKLHFSKWTSN